MSLLRSLKAPMSLRNSQHFMEPEGLLPVLKTQTVVANLWQIDPVHNLPSYSFKTHINIPSVLLPCLPNGFFLHVSPPHPFVTFMSYTDITGTHLQKQLYKILSTLCIRGTSQGENRVSKKKKDGKCTYTVTTKRLRVTIVCHVEAINMLYFHCGLPDCTTFFHTISKNGTIFERKNGT